MLDLKAFFASLRKSLFRNGMTQSQVDGINAILAAAEAHQVKDAHLAYMLATTYHETARTMQPIEEYGRGRGHRYGIKDPQTGQVYYGRGYVQLTWKANYEKASKKLGIDFVNRPEQVMELTLAARIMILGMQEGWFTGRKLSDYDRLDGQFNAIGARRIINGRNKKRHAAGMDVDADYDRVIAGHYDAFSLALKLSRVDAPISRPVDAAPPPPIERDEAPQREQGQTDTAEPSLLVKFLRWLFR